MPGGRRRKIRGGNFYGAAVDPQIGSAGLAYPSVENLAANPVTGALIPNDGVRGGRRRRGGKSSKKTARKTRRRRGGNDDPTAVEEEGTSIEETIDNPKEEIQRGGRRRKGGRKTKRRNRRGGNDDEGSGSGETAAGKGDGKVQTSFGPMTSAEIESAVAAVNSLPPQLRPQQGSRRKSKKGGRKSRRKMRGGNYVSSANVGASYQGSGVAGLANYSPYAPNVPGGGPSQNPDGVYSA